MKFAFVDGARREALPGLAGKCPTCGQPVVPRCGPIRIRHWSHRGLRRCDPWWENETEWHRQWKALFPREWQEVVFKPPTGERHIADVATSAGWTLEFQHSHLAAEERDAREHFYWRLAWVVDGTRRKNDRVRFFEVMRSGTRHPDHPLWQVTSQRSALLRDWAGSQAPVFFDFGQATDFDTKYLWCLIPGGVHGNAFVARIVRSRFIAMQHEADCRRFERLLAMLATLVAAASPISVMRRQPPLPAPSPSPFRRYSRPQTFRHFLARQARKRHRRF